MSVLDNSQSKQKPRRPCRFPGITGDAQTLGVSRNWLYAVLSGRYEAPELLARYRALRQPTVSPVDEVGQTRQAINGCGGGG